MNIASYFISTVLYCSAGLIPSFTHLQQLSYFLMLCCTADTRPWPLLTNDGFTEEELKKRREENRARRKRFRDRENDRDHFRGKN